MLQQAVGLSSAELEAIAGLERLVVQADGGRLKLEWGTLRSRRGDQVDDLLWWEDDQLVGFAGLYSFGGSLEITGMVAPFARRRGIAAALLDAALNAGRDRGRHQALLVVPRPSAGGSALATGHGGGLDHSEHALVLLGEPRSGPRDPRITLRRAVPADAAVLSRLIEAGFGLPSPAEAEILNSEEERTLVIELSGDPIGTVRLIHQGDEAGVYGFVVDDAHRGHGIGGDVLRRVCRDLRAAGAQRVGLEVAVENDSALGLYTKVGFTAIATEDYYAIPFGPPR